MKEQENIMPYYDERGVFHTVDQIKREREEAARRNQNNQNQNPLDIDNEDLETLNINNEMAAANAKEMQNNQNVTTGEQPNVPQAQVKVSPEFIRAVKNLHEAYKKLDEGAKKDRKKGLPLIENELEEFKAIADKEAKTNNIIEPDWKKTFNSQINLYGMPYIDFFVKDTAKKCGIANELGIELPNPDQERIQKLQSEKERIQRELDALNAKKGKEAEDNVEKDMKGFNIDKKGVKYKAYNFDADNAVREKQIKQSQENGYQNQEEVKSQDTFAMKKETRAIKYYGRVLQKEYSLGRRPASIKRMNESLEQLDKVMGELSGRTRLTADEIEAFDVAATNAYKTTEKFQKETKDKIANRKKIKNSDGKEVDDIKDAEKVALEGTEDIKKRITKLREKVFEKEIKAKVEEMKNKCTDESAKLNDERAKLAGKKELSEVDQVELKDNIARTLYYNNRMHDLGKQKRLSLEPGRTLGATMKKLENQIIPDAITLDYIKDSPLFKEIVQKAETKLKNGEAFTNEDVVAGQKAYEQKMGDQIRQQRMRNQNMNPHRENHRQLDQPTAGPTVPGMH